MYPSEHLFEATFSLFFYVCMFWYFLHYTWYRYLAVAAYINTAEFVMHVAVLNLLDWGPSNYLVAALHNSVYLYATGENPVQLTAVMDGYCSAVKWDSNGDKLIIGTNNSVLQVRIMLEQMNLLTIIRIIFEFLCR
jgi:energy-coupling factor transporter transmembrane protein EcfT